MSKPVEEAVTDTTSPDVGNAETESQAQGSMLAGEAEPTEEPKAAEPTEPAVPEKYDFDLPEHMVLDQSAADEFTAVAKELKLDQESVKKITDVAVKMTQRQADNQVKLVETWVEQVKTDKEIGGDKLSENLAVARKALETFGTPELRDVLNMTGMGNHPEVIRAFYKAGKAISEDRFVQGNPRGAEPDMAKRMFPTMN